jgi:hypothetical protein
MPLQNPYPKNSNISQPKKKNPPPTTARTKLVKVIQIFFCYAHEDELLLNKLKAHLKPLQRQGLIDMWHDRDISAGTEWENEIDRHLKVAQIILLLVSPDFMNSDYCYGKEMKQAIERHKRNEARVIPVILRPVYWQGALGHLQALPTDGKAVMSSNWHNLDEAFYDVEEGIRKALGEFATHIPASPSPSPDIDDIGVPLPGPIDTDTKEDKEVSSLYDEQIKINFLNFKDLIIAISSDLEKASFNQVLSGKRINAYKEDLFAIMQKIRSIDAEQASFFINSKPELEEGLRDIIDELNIMLKLLDDIERVDISIQQRTDGIREFNRSINNVKKNFDGVVREFLI